MAGYLVARLPDAGLDQVPDPSRGRTKWKLAQLLTGVVVGMMAGCKDLRDVEELTELLSPAIRRKLKLGGRQRTFQVTRVPEPSGSKRTSPLWSRTGAPATSR